MKMSKSAQIKGVKHTVVIFLTVIIDLVVKFTIHTLYRPPTLFNGTKGHSPQPAPIILLCPGLNHDGSPRQPRNTSRHRTQHPDPHHSAHGRQQSHSHILRPSANPTDRTQPIALNRPSSSSQPIALKRSLQTVSSRQPLIKLLKSSSPPLSWNTS